MNFCLKIRTTPSNQVLLLQINIATTMKNALLFLICLWSMSVSAQYYYNDIVGAKDLNERMRVYKANKVKMVNALGFDAQGAKSPDFNETQEVNSTGTLLKISTREGQNVNRQFYQFDEQGRLSTITDSSTGFKNTSSYQYDGNNDIVSISLVSGDTSFGQKEVHQWTYRKPHVPQKMLRILNDKDTTEYRFNADEKGNVTDEQLFRRNVGLDQLYYYYDDENHLTDIVRFDKKLKKLLPDFMFEYDDQNRVIQKITTLSAASKNYLIWRYVYNEKGLKTKEALFNKQKEMTGKIEYGFTYY
jgi:hypothetical protein